MTPYALIGFIGLSLLSAYASRHVVFKEDDVIYEPPSKVAIVLPAWNEPEEYLRTSIESILNQNIIRKYPRYFEYIFVGCKGIDTDVPLEYGFRVYCAPRSKLIARHIGIVNSEGDIIVSVDADTYYPPNWLNLMLKPYHTYPNVVATTGTTWQGAIEPFMHPLVIAAYNTRISGRASTLLKEAYLKVGGFNPDVDYTRQLEILMEEEINFRKRLQRIGRVVTVDAPVVHLGTDRKNRGLWVKGW